MKYGVYEVVEKACEEWSRGWAWTEVDHAGARLGVY